MYTKGPWKIDPVLPLAIIADNEDGDGICEMEGDPKNAEILANAALILAAPDMLGALEAAKFRMFGAGPSTDSLYAQVRAAIAKAKGET